MNYEQVVTSLEMLQVFRYTCLAVALILGTGLLISIGAAIYTKGYADGSKKSNGEQDGW